MYNLFQITETIVNITKLFKSLTVCIGILHSLTACQVNNMGSRCPQRLCTISLCCLFLNHGSEYSIGPWTLLVQVCFRDMPVFVPFLNDIYHFISVLEMFLYTIFQDNLVSVFSYLEFLMAIVKQVIYCLIINLNIWAYSIKIYQSDVFTRENCLILKWLAEPLWFYLNTLTWRSGLSLVHHHCGIAYLIFLIEDVFKAVW